MCQIIDLDNAFSVIRQDNPLDMDEEDAILAENAPNLWTDIPLVLDEEDLLEESDEDASTHIDPPAQDNLLGRQEDAPVYQAEDRRQEDAPVDTDGGPREPDTNPAPQQQQDGHDGAVTVCIYHNFTIQHHSSGNYSV